MDELQDAIHKFEKASSEFKHASATLDLSDPRAIRLLLTTAKRVRTASNLLVRRLAQERDTLQDR